MLAYFYVCTFSNNVSIKANLNFLAKTSTPDVAQYLLEWNLIVSCLRCWSTGLTQRELSMQCFTSMEMYAIKCTESQVCNDKNDNAKVKNVSPRVIKLIF